MVRFLLFVILAFFVARAAWRLVEGIVQGALEGERGGQARRHRMDTGVKMMRDPVCGTYVVPDRAKTLTMRGETIYFCSDKCRNEYRARK